MSTPQATHASRAGKAPAASLVEFERPTSPPESLPVGPTPIPTTDFAGGEGSLRDNGGIKKGREMMHVPLQNIVPMVTREEVTLPNFQIPETLVQFDGNHTGNKISFKSQPQHTTTVGMHILRPITDKEFSCERPRMPILGVSILDLSKSWPKRFRYRGLATHMSDRRDHLRNSNWTLDVCHNFEDVLGDAGIHGAVALAAQNYASPKQLMMALLELWNPETNSFYFQFGPMTITKTDMVHICGLPIYGRWVDEWLPSAETFSETYFNVPSNSNKPVISAVICDLFKEFHILASSKKATYTAVDTSSRVSYNAWLRHFYILSEEERQHISSGKPLKDGGEPEIPPWNANDENRTFSPTYLVAFLAYWLSRFVLPATRGDFIRPELFCMAGDMATGERYNLVDSTLCNIYKGLGDLWRFPGGGGALPWHYLYAWLASYFPKIQRGLRMPLGPVLNKLQSPPLMHRIMNGESENFSDRQCREFLRNENNVEWRPYGPSMEGVSVELMGTQGAEGNKYSSCLKAMIPCVLPYRQGLTWNLEPYLPNWCAKQFGLDQGCPEYLTNWSHPPRVTREFQDMKKHYAFGSIQKFRVKWRYAGKSRQGTCTRNFALWWGALMAPYFRISLDVILDHHRKTPTYLYTPVDFPGNIYHVRQTEEQEGGDISRKSSSQKRRKGTEVDATGEAMREAAPAVPPRVRNNQNLVITPDLHEEGIPSMRPGKGKGFMQAPSVAATRGPGKEKVSYFGRLSAPATIVNRIVSSVTGRSNKYLVTRPTTTPEERARGSDNTSSHNMDTDPRSSSPTPIGAELRDDMNGSPPGITSPSEGRVPPVIQISSGGSSRPVRPSPREVCESVDIRTTSQESSHHSLRSRSGIPAGSSGARSSHHTAEGFGDSAIPARRTSSTLQQIGEEASKRVSTSQRSAPLAADLEEGVVESSATHVFSAPPPPVSPPAISAGLMAMNADDARLNRANIRSAAFMAQRHLIDFLSGSRGRNKHVPYALERLIKRLTDEGHDTKPAVDFLNEWTGRYMNWEKLGRDKEMCSSLSQKRVLADLRKKQEEFHQLYATKAAKQLELLDESYEAVTKRITWRAKRDEHLRKAAEYDKKILDSEAAEDVIKADFNAIDDELELITGNNKLVIDELAFVSKNISAALGDETRRDTEIKEEEEAIEECFQFFLRSAWLTGLCNLEL